MAPPARTFGGGSAGPTKLPTHLRARIAACFDHKSAGVILARLSICSRADQDMSEAIAAQLCRSSAWSLAPSMRWARRLHLGTGPTLRPQKVVRAKVVRGRLEWDPPSQNPGVDDQITAYQTQLRFTRFLPLDYLSIAMEQQARRKGTSWADLACVDTTSVPLSGRTGHDFLGEGVRGSEQYRVRARNARGWGPWAQV